ncbi:MAG: hypothetical protein ACQEWE_05485 [Bacillota bacterium]
MKKLINYQKSGWKVVQTGLITGLSPEGAFQTFSYDFCSLEGISSPKRVYMPLN